MRYRVEHEEIKFVSTSEHVIFCLSYKQTNKDVCYDFPKISEQFSKISEDSSKVVRRPDERFRTFPKIFENYRRFPKITEDLRGGTDHRATNLRDYVTMGMGIFSLVKIAGYFHV